MANYEYAELRPVIEEMMSGANPNVHSLPVMTQDGAANVAIKVFPAGSPAKNFATGPQTEVAMGMAYYHDSGLVVAERHLQEASSYQRTRHGHGRCADLYDIPNEHAGMRKLENVGRHVAYGLTTGTFAERISPVIDEFQTSGTEYDVLRPDNEPAAGSRQIALLMEDCDTAHHMRAFEGLFVNQALAMALNRYVQL